MFDLTQMYSMPLDQLMGLDPTLLEKPLQMLESPQGMPVAPGIGPAFDSIINPQGPANLPPGATTPPAPAQQPAWNPLIGTQPAAPIVDKSVQVAPKPQLTADQMAKLAAGMQTPDTGRSMASPGTPASGRGIGQMQRLGGTPQAQQAPMTLAQLLSGRR